MVKLKTQRTQLVRLTEYATLATSNESQVSIHGRSHKQLSDWLISDLTPTNTSSFCLMHQLDNCRLMLCVGWPDGTGKHRRLGLTTRLCYVVQRSPIFHNQLIPVFISNIFLIIFFWKLILICFELPHRSL